PAPPAPAQPVSAPPPVPAVPAPPTTPAHRRSPDHHHSHGNEGFGRLVRAMLPWPARRHSPFEELVRTHRRIHPRTADLPLLHRAHQVAHQLHDGQVRRSGEPYISHPVAVARILAELGMDTTTLVSALLHDTVEDTSYTIEQLRRDFGDAVTLLVDGVTKLDGVFFGASAEAETIRKLIVAAGRDVRVLVIKLADRLHNMRTLKFKSRKSQLRTATATRDVLVPLADRLGIHVFKRELEDLVLETLDPEGYLTIERYLATREGRTGLFAEVTARFREELRAARVHASVTVRPRHHASIYADMHDSPICQPYDPPRLVVQIDGATADCYAALGAVHAVYRPAPGRFKDFIATPKFNLYQSLHTTVIGPGSEPVEVLLRTEEMHHTAEYGIVARYRTGNSNGGHGTVGRGEELDWLRRLVEWQSEAIDSSDFLTSLRCDLSEGQVQVFTTGGDQLTLPAGSTPVDVAYALSTTTGDRLIGTYVNGRLAPVTAMLDDGDVVEMIVASGEDYPGPSREWLQTVKTAASQLQINQWFANRDGAPEADPALAKKIAAGRLAVGQALRRQERTLANDAPLIALAQQLGYPDGDALYLAIADRRRSAEQIVDLLIASVDHQ
ncbi:MAG: RelA/SpoT family protein, partial [Micromonosporaceae bacterium]